MRRIAVSQRVEVITAYGERRDALDQRWARLLHEVAALCLPMPNFPDDTQAWLDAMEPDGIILSGGNDLAILGAKASSAPERDAHESHVLAWARTRQRPLLAVCRGLQMLNVFLGGRLMRQEGHVARRHALAVADPSGALGERADVNSFHDWGIDSTGLAAELEALATAPDESIEAVRHRDLPWYGIMWHPEREPTFHADDLRLIRNLFPDPA